MKAFPADVQLLEIRVTDANADGIYLRVQSRLDMQSRTRRGTTNEIDDDFIARQRTASPVERDLSKESMLDLVPFARPWRQVTDYDLKACLEGESSELFFPESIAIAIAAASVSTDH